MMTILKARDVAMTPRELHRRRAGPRVSGAPRLGRQEQGPGARGGGSHPRPNPPGQLHPRRGEVRCLTSPAAGIRSSPSPAPSAPPQKAAGACGPAATWQTSFTGIAAFRWTRRSSPSTARMRASGVTVRAGSSTRAGGCLGKVIPRWHRSVHEAMFPLFFLDGEDQLASVSGAIFSWLF